MPSGNSVVSVERKFLPLSISRQYIALVINVNKSLTLHYSALFLAAICYGSISVFAYYLSLFGVSSSQQTLIRIGLTALILFIGLGVINQFQGVIFQRHHLVFFFGYGLLGICAPLFSYITAIALGTPVVVAVSLAYLYPAITLIFGRIFLGEAITRYRMIALPLSVVAAVLVSFPLSPIISPIPLSGLLLSVATGVFLACNMIFGRKISGHLDYNPLVVTFWGYTIGGFWTGCLVLLLPFIIQDPRIVGFQFFLLPSTWLLLVGFAIIATAIPYSLTNFGMKKIDASAASIVLLFDPVSSIILGFFFMGQGVTFWHFIGASLIILASVLIALELKPKKKGSNS